MEEHMAEPITPETVISRSDSVITAEMGEETVMMGMEQGKYYGLDDIGSRIWELLEEPRTLSALCETLRDEFEVEETSCREDVLDFLQHMQEEDLIRLDA